MRYPEDKQALQFEEPRLRSESMRDHHPPHLHLDDAWYVISSATVGHAPFLASDADKLVVRDTLKSLIQQLGLTLLAWVILDNHYHLLLKTHQGEDMHRFIAKLHGSTSRQINLQNKTTGRQVWHNYWDCYVRGEADLWTRFNYVHQNPVKHGYVQCVEDWPFSSYHYYLRERGPEWLADCWRRYPVIDYLSRDDLPASPRHPA